MLCKKNATQKSKKLKVHCQVQICNPKYTNNIYSKPTYFKALRLLKLNLLVLNHDDSIYGAQSDFKLYQY